MSIGNPRGKGAGSGAGHRSYGFTQVEMEAREWPGYTYLVRSGELAINDRVGPHAYCITWYLLYLH